MVGLLVAVLISGLLLWFYERSTLLVLGLQPSWRRLLDLGFGLVASATLCAICLYSIAWVSTTTLTLNKDFTYITFLKSGYWMLKSVLTEELLFRGALLYIAIKKFGIKNACVLSSVAFGIYHWFSYGSWGNIVQMIYVFLLTGIAGLAFAYAFALTKSIFLPVGLHLGWNLVSVVLFSQGPLGKQWLISSGGQPLPVVWSVVFFIYQITLLPFAAYLYLQWRSGLSKNEYQSIS